MASLKEVVKQINKAWGEATLTTGDMIPDAKRISMGTPSADYALYGGIPLNTLTVFSGVEHSGKSLSACAVMAKYQQQYPDKCCIYVDAENTLIGQIGFISKMTGLITNDENRFLRYDCSGKAAEEIFDDIVKLQLADDIGMIIIDSAPALISQSDIENSIAKDNGMRSSVAKSLGKFIKRMLPLLPRKENSLLIINQVRELGKTISGATIFAEPCGYALRYYPSLKVRFGKRTFTRGEQADLTDSKAEESDGFRIKFSITKSRLGRIDRGGGFMTFRYNSGLDVLTDTLEVALKFGFIKRPTMQSYCLVNLDTGEQMEYDGKELKFVGKAKLIAFFKENPEFTESYVEMLTKHMSNAATGFNLLDEDDLQSIMDEENSISNSAQEQDEKEIDTACNVEE